MFATSLVTSAAACLLAGCETEAKPDVLATVIDNPAVHKAVKNLDDVISNLSGDVGDLETNNWREVTVMIKEGTVEIVDALAQLKRALGYPA